jgi:hypothetical protein
MPTQGKPHAAAKAKRRPRTKPPLATSTRRNKGRGANGPVAAGAASPRRSAKSELYGPTPGQPLPMSVPTEADFQRAVAGLGAADRAAFGQIMDALATHLGSREAARLWLVTPFSDFKSTPLQAILGGEAASVLALLESRWGPGAVHA